MGVLNVTPDSFSDGNKYYDTKKAIKRAFEIEKQGADILDIGAQSTRPNFTQISWEEEWNRLYPVLQAISGKINIPISVDTFYNEVAKRAIEEGATIVNDVSGATQKNLLKSVAQAKCPYILMCNIGAYSEDVKSFFIDKIKEIREAGIKPKNIILDPGIGFQKNYSQDIDIIKNISNCKLEGYPIMIGLSRKRVVMKSSDTLVRDTEIDKATAVANVLAIQNGANIVRVHDVKGTVACLKLVSKVNDEITKEILYG